MEFGSLEALAVRLVAQAMKQDVILNAGLEKICQAVENTAKGEIGTYQPAVGPFPAWAELADSTKADRLAKGFTENDPLLRDGALRESISHEVHALEAVVGSDSDIAVYQEFGTVKIPPRPFLGPAAIRNHEKIEKIAGEAALAGLIGTDQVHASLGYNQKI